MSAEPRKHDSEYIRNAHLPRLARDRAFQGSSEAPSRTLSERLSQMRVEDGRRERNRGNLDHSARALQPHRIDPTAYTSPSASARAGILFESSSQLAQQEQIKTREAGMLRGKFAGPAPPTSWRRDDQSEDVQKEIDHRYSVDVDSRMRSTRALRQFLDNESSDSGVLSLSDSCLSCIATDIQEANSVTKNTVVHMPMHLKDRLLGLAGRKQKCPALNEVALLSLLQVCKDVESAPDSILAEDWACKDDGSKTNAQSSIATLDLSYARIEGRRLKSILQDGPNLLQLRALSLAGFGYDDRTGQKSLVMMTSLMEMIGNMPHLEVLSLAKTRLYPTGKLEVSKSKESKMHDSMTFLKKLSRASLRLKILDLSECDWVVGPDIANLGWYSLDKVTSRSKIIWPRLEHLVLHNCTAFNEQDRKEKQFEASPSYVAKWHAAHHGVALVTDSPFLLSHRPGLGSAVLRASDPHAERLERQARQRRVVSRIRTGDEEAWGPSSDGGAETNIDDESPIRSSSSSAYPTRCPVSGVHVGSWEWERARVLDAVRGRWGSALNGDNSAHAIGSFIEVYF